MYGLRTLLKEIFRSPPRRARLAVYTPLHKLNQLQFTISMSFHCDTDENILRACSLQSFSFLVIFPPPGPSGRDALIFRVVENNRKVSSCLLALI